MTRYNDIILEIEGQIGIIKLNRPKSLNAFGGELQEEVVCAIRELNEHPDTVFTVLTGEGRFFSAGADVRSIEMLRSIIDHKKVFVLALNGPAVGGGSAWFTGSSDLVFASSSCYLQCNFSALGLVPENGSAINFAQSMGVHRANEFFMLGRKLTAQELEQWGIVNRVFDNEGFVDSVKAYLQEQLKNNDGKSMMEMKRLQNAPLRDGRMVAVLNAVDALAERFVENAPMERFAIKKKELEAQTVKIASGSILEAAAPGLGVCLTTYRRTQYHKHERNNQSAFLPRPDPSVSPFHFASMSNLAKGAIHQVRSPSQTPPTPRQAGVGVARELIALFWPAVDGAAVVALARSRLSVTAPEPGGRFAAHAAAL
ncbi:peroxisomal D3,D2-enoyl-CoA isomerase [Drepanopeziza brunnea f. sp. 'multigermtubi' MB_m1]|uniref:Peroxisomal D3,D2-enoyl-CoA isomerase n=1 Tax=Marssonina brunnea f. sp. multigermtubi (strain MB_m1) TaxID=1072389 RepID=K1X1R6_MARBU|nr:peroxisomal D3,D2-enoyl-CoA isomerase [Drepanopeziza brunnea f. sp. 'multigermtubi' MB_m1]EKD18957.1 peroxisomal D3,D2-enoyl-CoA isomerase [Drepanopeziza brunnea f. sp. 'multigermtubi' MB_m1]